MRKQMTPRMHGLVAAYVKSANLAEAARESGYSLRGASRLVNEHPLVKTEIEKLRAEVRVQTKFNVAAAFAKLEELEKRATADKQHNAAGKAIELQMRLHGLIDNDTRAHLNISILPILEERKRHLLGWVEDPPLLQIPRQGQADAQ